MIFKKTTTGDATLCDHMIDDVQNVFHRLVISKYRCSHAYCLIKLELLQFASNLFHFVSKVITYWVTIKLLHFGSIITFCGITHLLLS